MDISHRTGSQREKKTIRSFPRVCDTLNYAPNPQKVSGSSADSGLSNPCLSGVRWWANAGKTPLGFELASALISRIYRVWLFRIGCVREMLSKCREEDLGRGVAFEADI